MATFDAPDVRLMFEQRMDSLDNDTKRCFAPIDGVQFAPFPAVLYAFATVGGVAGAIKVQDGSERARPAVLAAVLGRLGILGDRLAAELAERCVVRGGGRPVGLIRTVDV